MSIAQKIFLSCKEATFLVSKKQETSISLFKSIQLKMHLLMCKFCALFNKQSNLIHHELKRRNDGNYESTTLQLNDATKINLQNKIDSEIEK